MSVILVFSGIKLFKFIVVNMTLIYYIALL